jgi:hypothetical protein
MEKKKNWKESSDEERVIDIEVHRAWRKQNMFWERE